ncbi:histidine phosphatase family protein [Ilumatobacter sp.]|uniref:histidine phosphatase family protein n=1 Tax=Ilumatobacter sp. TaxID=1967498 RepID=UPI003C4D551F
MLILLRHGRTAANEAGLLQGRLNQDLDDRGQRQARAAAHHLSQIDGGIDAVIASPLKRAQQTAGAFGIPIETDDRWIELSYGVYEGVPHADVPSEVWQTWRNDFSFVPDGGESLSTLDERVRLACDELVERAARQNVVVVSHVSPMKSAVAWALGVDIGIAWNCHLDHASICRIEIRGRRPVLSKFNETFDLEPA